MPPADDRPLVTFFVMAYNQERLVREAIEGAFAQTYRPLEIVLSDDASPDGTFRVMQEMAAAYDGPHRVVLNRNDRNLGIVPHIDRIMEIASGAFVVQSGGDDISDPRRAEHLVAAWLGAGRRAHLIHSAVAGLDAPHDVLRPNPVVDADTTPLMHVDENRYAIGATEGWSRDLFEVFGPLAPTAQLEDRVLPFRALLLGGVRFVDRPLVRYRPGGASDRRTPGDGREALLGWRPRYWRWYASSYRSYLEAMERVAPPEAETCRRICEERAERFELLGSLAEGSFPERLGAAPRVVRISLKTQDASLFRYWLKSLFPALYAVYWGMRRRSAHRLDA